MAIIIFSAQRCAFASVAFLLTTVRSSNPGTVSTQTDGYAYVCRLAGAVLEGSGLTDAAAAPKDGLRGCALLCSRRSQCVAFNYGPVPLPAASDDGDPTNGTCQLIGIGDVNGLSRTEAAAHFYYEMNCDQFCFIYNAELKLLPCLVNLSVQLRRLPMCDCEHLKTKCPLSSQGEPLLPIG